MGTVRELSAGNALKQRRDEKTMNGISDKWPDPGDLLHAALEDWIIAEISDATPAEMQPVPAIESSRGPGIQSSRSNRVAISRRFRPAK
jgi:hypothetical protein